MTEQMAPGRIAAQMIDFMRLTTVNTWNTVALFHELTEKTFTSMMERPFNSEKEHVKVWQEWIGNNKRTRDELSRIVEENFDRAQAFFAPRNDS